MILCRLILALASISLFASAAYATDRKPLVLGSSGQQQQIQSGDTLSVPNAKVTSISGSTQCVQASTTGLLSGTGAACGAGGGGGACSAGTSFPGSPTTGQCIFRTDRGIEYYYDGTRWLSVNYYSSVAYAQNLAGNTNFTAIGNPWSGVYDIYLYSAIYTTNIVGSGTATWTLDTYKFSGATFATLGTQQNTSSDANQTYTTHTNSINAVVTSSYQGFQVNVAKTTGTGGLAFTVTFLYRLVG